MMDPSTHHVDLNHPVPPYHHNYGVPPAKFRYSRKSDYAQQINDCNPYGQHNSTNSYCESVVAYVSDSSGRNWCRIITSL